MSLSKKGGGLPWWLSGKESTCQCRSRGFGSWSGTIPHASEQLSPCATTTEPVLWSLEPQLLKTVYPSACAPLNRGIHGSVCSGLVVNRRKRKASISFYHQNSWWWGKNKDAHLSHVKLILEIQRAGTCDFLCNHIFPELSSISCCQQHTSWKLISALLLLSRSYQFFWHNNYKMVWHPRSRIINILEYI